MRYRASPDLVTRTIAGETLVVPVRGRVEDLDAIYSVNESGSLIWRLVQEGATTRGIADELAREYDVSPSDAARDVAAFLDAFEAAGLVRRVEG